MYIIKICRIFLDSPKVRIWLSRAFAVFTVSTHAIIIPGDLYDPRVFSDDYDASIVGDR